jgi:mRNA interferase MazF
MGLLPMVLKKNNPLQGEIWLFDPDPVKGNEIGKKVRPALVVSNNLMNEGASGLVINLSFGFISLFFR